MEPKKTQTEEQGLLPIERENLRPEAVLDELRKIQGNYLRYIISNATDVLSIKVELSLEALQEFTGITIAGAKDRPLLHARYVYAEDTYHLVGIDIADTSIGSPATNLSKAILSEHAIRRAIIDALQSYELAAALYRSK